MDYELFIRLTKDVPLGLDRLQVKEKLTSKAVLGLILRRDGVMCRLCGETCGGLERSIHHILPNGKVDEANLITLCRWCHQVVHLVLWRDKKWKFPLRNEMRWSDG